MKKLILGILAILALTFALGSVGAYDNGNIGLLRLIIQVAISVAVEWYALSHLDD